MAQLAKLHLQEFIKDCQQPKRFLYLCTFPVLQPVQHYLAGVCSSRSWIIKFTNVLVHNEIHLRCWKKAPSSSLLGQSLFLSSISFLSSRSSFSAQSSCPQSSLSPHPHPLVKLSGRMLLVMLEKIHQTLGEEGRFTP